MDPSTLLIPLDSPLDMADQFSFLDVSLEDDSLLPTGTNEELLDGSHAQHSPSVMKTFDASVDTHAISATSSVHENVSVCQDVSDETGGIDLPELSQEPVMKKKTKKKGFNLRKSLAWNNAFMTEEGVLDSEELSIVNKTFQKIPERPKASSHWQSSQASSQPLKPAMIPKAHLPSNRVASSVNGQHLPVPVMSARNSVNSLIGTGLKRPEQCLSNSTGSTGIKHGVLKPPLTSRIQPSSSNQEKPVATSEMEAYEVDLQLKTKDTDKRSFGSSSLSSDAFGNREIDELEPSRKSVTFASESISMKGVSHPKSVTINSKKFTMCGKSERSKKLKPPYPAGHQAQPVTTAAAAKIASSTYNVIKSSHIEKPGIVSRDKPSGLRMPSPKLGFFDASRLTSQVVTNSTETTAIQSNTASRIDVNGNNMQNSRLKLPSASVKSRKNTESTVSDINKRADISSSSIASGPLTRITEIPSMSATLLGSGRSSLNLPNRKKPENFIQVLQVKNNVHNISPVAESPKPLFTVKDTPGQENTFRNWQVGKGTTQHLEHDVVLRSTNPMIDNP